ncbi:MAG: hypothetical protein M3Z46_08155 [Actinomycetota bacterium]|nr:hypothetical protein [Actinomycetota bacterium]
MERRGPVRVGRVGRVVGGAVLAALLAGCGGEGAPSRSRVQAALVTSGLRTSEARCATKQLFSVLSTSQLRNLAERGSGALNDKSATALSTALATCVPGAFPTTTTPAGSSPSATTTPQTAPSTS